VVKLVQHQENQEWQAILDWLPSIDYAAQQSDFVSRRQEGTGQWLLESVEFQAWVKSDQQVLFCPGIPGAGKTILTSIVVDYLYTKFQEDMDIGIAYLYCDFRQQDRQKVERLLASLLKQLAQGLPYLPESVKSLYDSHKDKRTQPTFNEISGALQSVSALYSRIFIAIDALDECQASDGCRTRLLTEIFAFQEKSRTNIFTTSRFIPEISEHFKDSIQLEIRANDHDVQRYLEGHMSQLPRCVLSSSELQDEIKAEIIRAVDGMYVNSYALRIVLITYRFLLALLHFNSLKGKTSARAIRTALKKLPTGSEAYDDAYNDALERIEGQLADKKRLAKKVLSWITCAKRPLTTFELEHALAVELRESQFDKENLSPIEDVVSVCAGLVTVDRESSIIRLVHYTTQEYFERTQNRWFPDAETDIATICVTYLLFDEFKSGFCQNDQDFEKRLQLNPLYDYASHNWGHHARAASMLIPEVNIFLERRAQVESSIQALLAVKRYSSDSGYSQRFPKKMRGLHLAAYFGVKAVVQLLLEKEPDVNLKASDGRTPLHWASMNGHVEVVKLLLEKGADVAVASQSGSTPLHWGSMNGHVEVIKLLLEKGPDVEAADQYGSTPLHRASVNGHVEVIKLLLEKGADVAAAGQSGSTPLHWASMNGHVEVLKLLLEKGADVAAAGRSRSTPLHWASENGHVEAVKLLLENGGDVAAADQSGSTPLHWASMNGHVEAVKLLLKNGADVVVAGRSGSTPLHFGSRNGHIEVVKLLLEKGPNVAAADRYGSTPLHWASKNGHVEVIKLLLEKGADIVAANRSGSTPMHLASKNRHVQVIKLLLEKGAEVVVVEKYINDEHVDIIK
jgi:ankyrin repeat protein